MPFTYLALSNKVYSDVAEFPDSDKVLIRSTRLIARRTRSSTTSTASSDPGAARSGALPLRVRCMLRARWLDVTSSLIARGILAARGIAILIPR